MKTKPNPYRPHSNFASSTAPAVMALAAMLSSFTAMQSQAQVITGFNQTGAGPHDYNDTANWVDSDGVAGASLGDINGIWDPSLTLTVAQTTTFGANTTLPAGLSFRYLGDKNQTLRAAGGPFTLTLAGDILVFVSGNQTVTIGSTSASENLNVDLGGAVRTLTAFGGGNGANFADSLTFINTVSNGGIIASGGGSGGGRIQFNALSTSFTSATVRDAELAFNGSSNNSADTVHTISGALTGGGGAGTITVTPRSSTTQRHNLVQAASFVRNAGSTILFRGTALGTQTIASATPNTANIKFVSAPTLLGGGGAAETSTINIMAGSFGDTSSTGTGFGATGGLVTYDADKGVRLLSGSEYKSSITDGQTALDNVRITNSSGTIATTTLTTATNPITTINALSLGVSGATGNQGITITGDPDTTLKLNSGVIYAEQNVTTAGSPATTDAMTLSVPTLDLNGQEGIILATTRLNTGGTITSNGALIITSTITNGTGLIIGDNIASGSGGYVSLRGSAANTHTGNTTINGAIVQLNKSVANLFGDIVLNLGAVYNPGNQVADTANVTINGGNFYLNGSNNSGSAANETLNNLTMTGGSVEPGSANGHTFNVNGNAALSGGTVRMAQNAKLNITGTTGLSGGVISVGTNNSASVYNSKTKLNGAVSITNTAAGTAPYIPITIAAGSAAGNLGGQVELTGDLTFAGTTNTNTVTIAAPTGTGVQGVLAMNGDRTFDIGNGAAEVDLTINAPVIDGPSPGILIKTGPGTLALNGTNAYTGDTTVSEGTLSLGTASLEDFGAVNVQGSAVLHLAHGGTDIVVEFQINGFPQGNGIFNAANSSGRITGPGSLQVGVSTDPFIAWINTFTSLTDPGDKTKDADPDNDGLNNAAEFALDGNPASGAASGKVRSQVETVGADQALVITLPVRAGAVFDNTPGPAADATIGNLIYTIEGTNELTTFDQGVTEIAVSSGGMPSLTDANWTYRTFRLNGAVGGVTPRGPKGFLRAVIVGTP